MRIASAVWRQLAVLTCCVPHCCGCRGCRASYLETQTLCQFPSADCKWAMNKFDTASNTVTQLFGFDDYEHPIFNGDGGALAAMFWQPLKVFRDLGDGKMRLFGKESVPKTASVYNDCENMVVAEDDGSGGIVVVSRWLARAVRFRVPACGGLYVCTTHPSSFSSGAITCWMVLETAHMPRPPPVTTPNGSVTITCGCPTYSASTMRVDDVLLLVVHAVFVVVVAAGCSTLTTMCLLRGLRAPKVLSGSGTANTSLTTASTVPCELSTTLRRPEALSCKLV